MATTTTREGWHFTPYNIERRGERNVPNEYLKETVWGKVNGVTGYYAQPRGTSKQYQAVEFNFERKCWCEVRYKDTGRHGEGDWEVYRPALEDLDCDILHQEAFPELHAWREARAAEESEEVASTPEQLEDIHEAEEDNQVTATTSPIMATNTQTQGVTTQEESLAQGLEQVHIRKTNDPLDQPPPRPFFGGGGGGGGGGGNGGNNPDANPNNDAHRHNGRLLRL